MAYVTLCGANRSLRKYYFNPDFAKIPKAVQDELQIICVTFAEECGGAFTIDFDEEGDPLFSVHPGETEADIDEISAELMVRRLQEEKEDLMQQLKLFYRVFVKGENLADLVEE